MGQVSTEQAIAIIDAAKSEAKDPNYWWLLLIAVVPVVLAPFVANWVRKRNK